MHYRLLTDFEKADKRSATLILFMNFSMKTKFIFSVVLFWCVFVLPQKIAVPEFATDQICLFIFVFLYWQDEKSGDSNSKVEAIHFSELDVKTMKIQELRDQLDARGLSSKGKRTRLNWSK